MGVVRRQEEEDEEERRVVGRDEGDVMDETSLPIVSDLFDRR